jgi:hypothetical protein
LAINLALILLSLSALYFVLLQIVVFAPRLRPWIVAALCLGVALTGLLGVRPLMRDKALAEADSSLSDIRILDFERKPNIYFLGFDALMPQALTRKLLEIDRPPYIDVIAAHGGKVIPNLFADEVPERLYLRLRARDDKKVLPLVMNLANPSPNQGWASGERLAFDSRNKPDLILGLALIHHICLGNNVPIPNFLDWLVMTGARLVIEFVDRSDGMVREILERKTETHDDYNLANFERELRRRYEILSSAPLKGGERRIYYCAPLA